MNRRFLSKNKGFLAHGNIKPAGKLMAEGEEVHEELCIHSDCDLEHELWVTLEDTGQTRAMTGRSAVS